MLVAMETYKEKHIIFLQGLMCKGVLNSKEVNALYEKALAVCKIRGKDQIVFLKLITILSIFHMLTLQIICS